jgi:coproporphyrinogen III oxidase-like Fe-S oxidoreductase
VNKKQIVQFGGFSKQESILLQRLIREGKVREEKSCYVLTSSGFLFADAIAQDFFRLL